MLREAIYHRPGSDYAYPISVNQFVIKLRSKKGELESVDIIYADKYRYVFEAEHTMKSVNLKKVATDSYFDYFEVTLDYNMNSICYYFKLSGKNEALFYGNYEFYNSVPENPTQMFITPAIADKDIFKTPEWAREAIVYLVFPDRFCRGMDNFGQNKFDPWYSQVTPESVLGGDLQGVIDKIDYIEQLGVNVIYLTPIFKAGSSHKYDAYDYYEIDPQFGDTETLKKLVSEAHKRNIKVILDGVFNHCGIGFEPFADVLAKGEASAYKDWFYIRKYPVEVKSEPDYLKFVNCKMPKIRTENPEVVKYFIDVGTYWIKEADIDGWRLDVADGVDQTFWREFRTAIKQVKQDALIIGDIWYNADPWLQGDQYDTNMNYLFSGAVGDFIASEKISAKAFAEKLGYIRGLYKLPAHNLMWNLIDCHDTPRFLHSSGEDKRKLKLAALLQFTLPGIPVVYYGDEVGMTGGGDPDCRRGMIWDEKMQDKDFLEFYKKLISLRNQKQVLKLGECSIVFTSDSEQVIGFRKTYKDEAFDVYINNAEAVYKLELSCNQDFKDILNEKTYSPVNGKVTIEISAKAGVILESIK